MHARYNPVENCEYLRCSGAQALPLRCLYGPELWVTVQCCAVARVASVASVASVANALDRLHRLRTLHTSSHDGRTRHAFHVATADVQPLMRQRETPWGLGYQAPFRGNAKYWWLSKLNLS